jgi:osmotically-inducible protein OsmY
MERLRKRYTIVLAIWVLASVALFAQGCNTTQSPNQQVSDAQITTQVKTDLAQNVRASSLTNLEVNTTNGVVTLAGQVESEEVKHNSETVAASVPGVVRVNNELQVASAASFVR